MMLSRRSLLRVLVPAVTLAVVLTGWQVAANGNEAFILPGPGKVIEALFANWGPLIRSLGVTLGLTALALSASVVVAALLAALMAQSRWVELAVYPYAVVLQVTPIFVITPMILIWVRDTNAAMLIIAFIISFFPILSNTLQGLKSADHGLLNLFELYGAGRWQTLRLLRAPSALPYFLTGLRNAGGLALVGVVVAEFAAGRGGAGSGLAYRIFTAQNDLATARAFAALLLLAAAGVAIFVVTGALTKRALRRWHESEAAREN